MANKERGIQRFTVQESTNIVLPRLIAVEATQVADDNADNDVAFNWVKVPNASVLPGHATRLVSAAVYDHGIGLAIMDLVFCRGSGDSGTAPTTAQNLQDGAAGSAAVDMTSAEGQAIKVCGSVSLSAVYESELVLSNILSRGNIDLIMSPAANSRDLYVGGIWRADPADNSTGATTMDVYLGFEG